MFVRRRSARWPSLPWRSDGVLCRSAAAIAISSDAIRSRKGCELAQARESRSAHVGGGRDQKFGFHRGSGPGRSESEPRSGPVLVLVLVLVRVPVLVRVRVWVPAWSWSWSWSWSLVGKTKCSFRLFQAVQRDLLFVPNFGPWSLVRVRVGSLILVLVQPRGWSWSWPSPGPGPVPVLPSPSPGFGPVLARSGPGPGGWSGSRPPPSRASPKSRVLGRPASRVSGTRPLARMLISLAT